MSHVTTTHTESAVRLEQLASILGSAVALPAAWMKRMRNRRELMGLASQPDYYLKDVGLQRDEITREGLKPFWRS